ncbi:hypothetical protein NSERUTF1_7337 [Nocardia seriolae]|nr:hypothetical protein NSERUTF1_7337 [Nocardia seriolae]
MVGTRSHVRTHLARHGCRRSVLSILERGGFLDSDKETATPDTIIPDQQPE